MNQKTNQLTVIDSETLMDARLPRRSFCIETLLPEGISMLGGAPKIGKSWMVLDIGIHVVLRRRREDKVKRILRRR